MQTATYSITSLYFCKNSTASNCFVYYQQLEQKEDKIKTWTNKLRKVQNKVHQHLKCLILDFSSVSHVDPSGVAMLKALSDNFRKLGIAVYIASCKGELMFRY